MAEGEEADFFHGEKADVNALLLVAFAREYRDFWLFVSARGKSRFPETDTVVSQ
jgi:hypothetical protein